MNIIARTGYDIKSPEDILKFMDNIEYGYVDINGNIHKGELKGFRKIYKTMSIDEILDTKVGTCIEQVYLMHILLDELNIENKMYCTRIYEHGDIDDTEDEHMHCFILYFINDKVYQIEHPNPELVGIYSYDSEIDAISKINAIYEEYVDGAKRPVTLFEDVLPGLSFREFNDYINSLDILKKEI